MKQVLKALLTIVGIVGCTQTATAQYMYLDANGNGIHDAGDRLNANGTATTVDLFVRTNQNRDGSTAVCDTDPGTPLTVNGYQINLIAVGGTVTYSGFVNQFPLSSISLGELNPDGVRYKNGFGSGLNLPPGQYRLCTLTITGVTGTPGIDIVDLVSESADFTGFWTFCPGRVFDSLYRLDGPNVPPATGDVGDFTDWDGLDPAGGPNNPPVLASIGPKTACGVGYTLTFTATATDLDAGETLTFSLDPGAPPGATINATTGAFSWTPSAMATFPATIRVTDNAAIPLSDFEAFTITVGGGPNNPPFLGAIGNKTVDELSTLTFTATASDAGTCEGSTLAFSLDPGAPENATIDPNTGAFSWRPLEPEGPGSYSITIRVTDNGHPDPPLSDFETITVTVNEVNDAPTLAPIGNKTVDEWELLTFMATATDPDPRALFIFTLGPGAPTAAQMNPGGLFQWIPGESQGPGFHPITVRVTSSTSGLSDFETFTVRVNEINEAPVLNAIGNKTVTTGSTLTFTATATDRDLPANALCFTLANVPPVGATINCATGVFSWTPSLGQLGAFAITVRVTDNGLPPLSGEETILVTVRPEATTPTAHAGGPYSGVVYAPVSFDGTGSSDPEGDALTYRWSFGDGNTGSGATSSHAYTVPGTYNVFLRVTDPDGNFDEDATSVTIGDQIFVALALKNGKSTIDLNGNEPLKAAIENPELVYTDVIVSNVRLSTDYPNAGTVSECAADPKHTRVGDLDGNSVPDLEVRFSADCLRNLFRNVPNNTTVNLIITGEVRTVIGPVPLRGVAVVTIKRGGGGGGAAVLVYPNPMNPQAMLSFVTKNAGGASIQLFDLQGRLVRTLLPQQYLEAGAHEVTIDGMNDQGTHLSSGVYFYRVRTADGTTEGSISVLK